MAGVTISENFDTEVTSTMRNYLEQTPIDQIFDGNLLLGILFTGEIPGGGRVAPGRVRREDGGREVAIPVAYKRSSNITAFQGMDTISLNADEVATIARAPWSYYVDSVILTKQEFWENRGSNALFSILEARTNMSRRTIAERVNTDLHSTGDGLSTAPKNIIGIQSLLPLDPSTGTVWGLDRNVYSWWGSYGNDPSQKFSVGGLNKLGLAYLQTSGTNAEDPFHLALTTPTQWSLYHDQVTAKQQITTTKIGDRGYPTLEYMGRPIFHSSLVPTGTWFMLNMDYAVLCLQNGVDFTVSQATPPANQVIHSIWQIFFSGQFGFERYDRQGRVFFDAE